MRISDWSSDVCSSDLSAAVIALFAIGHGFAHGSEMGAGASAYPFAGGFLIATALLHGLGLLVSRWATGAAQRRVGRATGLVVLVAAATMTRSEEHTSELQSLMRISYAVFCLKKKTQKKANYITSTTKEK